MAGPNRVAVIASLPGPDHMGPTDFGKLGKSTIPKLGYGLVPRRVFSIATVDA